MTKEAESRSAPVAPHASRPLIPRFAACPPLSAHAPLLPSFLCPQVKGVADAGAASLRVSGLELGGLFGSLLAGKLSDMLINNSKGQGGNVGKRIQVGPPLAASALGAERQGMRPAGRLSPPPAMSPQS